MLALAGRVRDHLAGRARELGLTAQEMDVLLAVDDAPYSMSELAEHVRVDPANLTRIIRRLERRGLIAHHRHEHDKRLKAVTLTEDGERLHEAFRARMTVDFPAVAGLTDRQRAQLLDLLGRVARASRPLKRMTDRRGDRARRRLAARRQVRESGSDLTGVKDYVRRAG